MVTAYPVNGKKKSYEICRAFVSGCAGALVMNAQKLYPGAAVFYGVDDSNAHLWEQVLMQQRDFYYCDNAYFDEARQTYFRVTKNGTQHHGRGVSDCSRFQSLGISIKPWTQDGHNILICPQSEHFMRVIARAHGNWVNELLEELAPLTGRKIVIRSWHADKSAMASTLDADLADAHCLVTWSSAAAVSALLRGVPVIVQGDSPAKSMGGTVQNLEVLPHPARETWAGVLADNQWTLDEMRSGKAWEALNAE